MRKDGQCFARIKRIKFSSFFVFFTMSLKLWRIFAQSKLWKLNLKAASTLCCEINNLGQKWKVFSFLTIFLLYWRKWMSNLLHEFSSFFWKRLLSALKFRPKAGKKIHHKRLDFQYYSFQNLGNKTLPGLARLSVKVLLVSPLFLKKFFTFSFMANLLFSILL